jgi:glycerophosphoryl diester phosphodiesterase
MTRWRAGVLSAIAAVAMTLFGVAAASAETQHLTFDLQAHRGGRGLRPESTLASFANGCGSA